MSRPADDRVDLFQARAETRAEWPRSSRICLERSASHSCTCRGSNVNVQRQGCARGRFGI